MGVSSMLGWRSYGSQASSPSLLRFRGDTPLVGQPQPGAAPVGIPWSSEELLASRPVIRAPPVSEEEPGDALRSLDIDCIAPVPLRQPTILASAAERRCADLRIRAWETTPTGSHS